MSHIKVNPNPCGNYVGDCVIRALSIAMGKPWKEVYIGLCLHGYELCDMPSSNRVWADYLSEHGYTMHTTSGGNVRDFCIDHPKGIYILGTGTHVLAVMDGDYYDSWDSGDEYPIYYWYKEEEMKNGL